ncbi:ATP-binding protein [Streptomyces sp. DT171]|uniref:ATP-binding protein n=1 Tax=Streptomyces sp. DT171 TaxID=3416524 RepID=UPI003CEE1D82
MAREAVVGRAAQSGPAGPWSPGAQVGDRRTESDTGRRLGGDRPASQAQPGRATCRTHRRLARRLASHRVHTWGHRYGTEVNDTVSLIVGELTVNAVTHGRAPGRDARLRVTGERLRVEVTDTRGGADARCTGDRVRRGGGRGLVLVAALCREWGVDERKGAPGKTV